MNEAFRAARGGDVELDPLTGLDDATKPLRSKLLSVPALRARYLEKVRTLAEKDLDWKNLGPVVARYREIWDGEIAADTRKSSTIAAFRNLTAETPAAADGGRGAMPLRTFADRRRAYLLSLPANTAKQ